MPRSEFLEAAKEVLGYAPSPRCLEWAIKTGDIPKPRRFGRHYAYDEHHLAAFVRYMRTKSPLGKAIAKAVAS